MKAVLFDLDGTLADTAPDLGDALNRLLKEESHAPLPAEQVRKCASFGAPGLLAAGFAALSGDEEERLTTRFLELYAQQLCDKTQLFCGATALFEGLERRGLVWGVVTNKHQRFARPILKKLGVYEKMRCFVCGDMVKRKKPAPDALLSAAEMIATAPAECLYVGDSERDVVAAKAAGMSVLVVAYGYEVQAADTSTWNHDGVVNELTGILSYIDGL